MGIYDSELWISDLDEVIISSPVIQELAGKRVLITGCTGLVCSALVDVLIRWNETHIDNIQILAAGRSEMRIRQRFSPFDNRHWFHYIPYDAIGTERMDAECDYIIHGAGNASPNMIIRQPVETMIGNINGLKILLDCVDKQHAERLLLISSSEIYGIKEGVHSYQTDEYGYIDLLNPRSSYSMGKRAAETLCASYADEYGVDSVIVRPGHIYGPTATRSDNRVASFWAYTAAEGKDIVMKSEGSQIRSYCYCLDSAMAILTVLLKGESVKAYNISNPDSVISIRDMAMILANFAGVKLKMDLPTKSEIKGFNPMMNSTLNGSELMELGWRGIFDAERGFGHTVEIIKKAGQTLL